MEEALLVYVNQSFDELFGDVSDLILLQSFALLLAIGHQFVEILFKVLEHKVCLVDDSYDFLEFDDVGMVHFAKCLDLR